jgi:hypothetical protein
MGLSYIQLNVIVQIINPIIVKQLIKITEVAFVLGVLIQFNSVDEITIVLKVIRI